MWLTERLNQLILSASYAVTMVESLTTDLATWKQPEEAKREPDTYWHVLLPPSQVI